MSSNKLVKLVHLVG